MRQANRMSRYCLPCEKWKKICQVYQVPLPSIEISCNSDSRSDISNYNIYGQLDQMVIINTNV